MVESRTTQFWRYVGIFMFCLVGLAIAGGILALVLRGFDRETLLTLAILGLLGQFIAWPAGWSLGIYFTQRLYQSWLSAHGTQRAAQPPSEPAEPRTQAIQPINLTEAEAGEWLARLNT